jgi:hypothetical protein
MYCASVSPSSMMVWSIAFSIATSAPGLKARCRQAWRESCCRRGSITTSFAPRSRTAFLMKVAATGWFTAGLAPMTTITSASNAAAKGAVTAPELSPSMSAATDEAWHSLVQ